MLFSDESVYQQTFNSHLHVFRKNGSRLDLTNTICRKKRSNCKIMIFGIISREKIGSLYLIEGTVNKEKYDKMLREWVKPFIET